MFKAILQIELKRKNRGVKQAGFIVLHQTYMPSILIETGFITNKKEGDYLNSKKGQAQISKSIAEAILKYKSQLEFNVGEQITADIPEENKTLNQTVYKIQIAASSRKVKTSAKALQGLKDVTVQKNGEIYRYFYSQTTDFKKAQQLKRAVRRVALKMLLLNVLILNFSLIFKAYKKQ